MKKIILQIIILFIGFKLESYSQIIKTCTSSCDVPSAAWSTVACEAFESKSVGDLINTTDWILYPFSQGYNPRSAIINLAHLGQSWVKYADFLYAGQPVDNYYKLNIGVEDYRFNFDLFIFSGMRAQLAIKNSSLNDILYLIFQSNGTAEIFNASNTNIGSFSFQFGSWINMNMFFHSNGTMEIFRNNFKVAGFKNIQTGINTFPSRYNFFSDKAGDGFCLGEVCVVTNNKNMILCDQSYNPVCLKGTNEEVGTNACHASANGYFSSEFQNCGFSNDPCLDCDECFSYWFDCADYRKCYFQNNYCDFTPVLTSNRTESLPTTEYDWEFKNESGNIISPEFLSGTNSTSFSPLCRFPGSGLFTVCLKVYKYQENGRYIAFTCCYVIKVNLPCSSTPTLHITSTTANTNNEVTFTTNSTNAENFSWRIDDPTALINGQSTTTSGFKCKIPSGRNCVRVCLTVGNGCGMTSKCIKVCTNNINCGTKPPVHTPITYTVNSSGDVSFTNIPQMDSYNWTFPAGCVLRTGDASSQSPICRIPDLNCSYLFCLAMKLGSCYEVCYCFTIRNTAPSTTVTFDPDEMACVPSGTRLLVPVRVKGFKNMTSAELSFNLSPTSVASFESAELGPNVGSTSIIPNVISSTKMVVGWAGTTGSPTSLQDNDILFYLVLNMNGAVNTTATITIDNTTAKAKQNGVSVPVTLRTGTVCINGTFSLCGKILREDNKPIRNVMVEVSGPISLGTLTDAQGMYCFSSLPAGNYTIKPKKTNNPGNGVEIQDIADLKGQIARTYTLPSPYRLIAADVDNSKQIDAVDIARMVQTYKDKNRVFPSVDSWRFVPTSYQFPNALNPFSSTFAEFSSVNLSKNENAMNFVGIKMGDLDLDNDPQSLVKDETNVQIPKTLSTRSVPSLDLIIPNDTVKPGATLKIPVYCKGFNNVLSFGFSIAWPKDKLKFQNASKFNSKLGIKQSDLLTTNADNGSLSTIWNTFDVNGVTLQDKDPLFWLEFQVLANDKEEVSINFINTPVPISFADPNDRFNVISNPSNINIDRTAVAVNDAKLKDEIIVYPNPVNTDLFISLPRSSIQDYSISIINSSGVEMKVPVSKVSTSTLKLDVQNLKQGYYNLQITSSNRHHITKFIKM